MGEDEKHHAAAQGSAVAPPTETDGARKRNRQKDGNGTGTGSGIGKGNGNGTGNNNRNWNYRLLRQKTKNPAEAGTAEKPKSICTEKQVWGKVVQNKQTRRYNFVQHSVLQNDAIFATM